MPVVRASDALVHDLHGVRFVSYAATATGSREICAWRGEVPPRTAGPAHVISREEVFLVLGGTPRLSLDGDPHDLSPATWPSHPPDAPWCWRIRRTSPPRSG